MGRSVNQLIKTKTTIIVTYYIIIVMYYIVIVLCYVIIVMYYIIIVMYYIIIVMCYIIIVMYYIIIVTLHFTVTCNDQCFIFSEKKLSSLARSLTKVKEHYIVIYCNHYLLQYKIQKCVV